MKLVSMKLKKADKADAKACCCDCSGPGCECDEEKDRYPWGLRVTLENEQLDALKMPLPKGGDTFPLSAVVKVVGVRSCETEGGEVRSLELQITDLGMEGKGGVDMAKTADKLYGDGGN